MLVYLLKMMACSAIFYSLYAFLFQREKMLVFNRLYLLGTLAVSLLIPLITFTVKQPVAVLLGNKPVQYLGPAILRTPSGQQPEQGFLSLDTLLVYIMVLVSLFLLFRLLKNVYRIRSLRLQSPCVYKSNIRVALIEEELVPYSFWDTVYLNKKEYLQGGIEAEVMEHELAHIRQRHSLDIIIVEVIQVFTWFNPFLYLYKRSIKINHELLADAAVIRRADDVRSYQNILLQRASLLSSIGLASSFNFFITKKRLIMLTKKFNKKRTILFSLAVVPALSLALIMGCNTVTEKEESQRASSDSLAQPLTANSENKAEVNGGDSSVTGLTRDSAEVKTKKIPFPKPKIVNQSPAGPGATSGEMAEYEALLKKYRTANGGYKLTIENKMARVLAIYNKMTIEQRSMATALPPPPPPTLPPPVLIEPKPFELPKDIRNIEVRAGKNNEDTIVTIFYKNGNKVDVDISTPEKKSAFVKKYGNILPPPPPALPMAPPPPPAPPVKQKSSH